jgi:hypothetical protein
MRILAKTCVADGAPTLAAEAVSTQSAKTRRRLTTLAGVGLALAVGMGPALAADDPLLSRLEGKWIGQGTVQNKPGGTEERIYCKVANKLVNGGTTLQQNGRCAVASNSGKLVGKIAATGQGNYKGSMDSPQTKGPATLAGRAKNDTIVLSANFVDRASKKKENSTISLVVGDGTTYRLVSDKSNILFTPDK